MTTSLRIPKHWWLMGLLALVIAALPALRVEPVSASTAWNVGDVFVGVASGTYQVYDNNAAPKETLADPLALGGSPRAAPLIPTSRNSIPPTSPLGRS